MVIASPTRLERWRARVAGLALVLGLGACASRPPPPGGELLMPLANPAPWLPEPSDRVAARAAAAALADDKAALKEAVAKLATLSDTHKGEDLDALATDLLHSTLVDP